MTSTESWENGDSHFIQNDPALCWYVFEHSADKQPTVSACWCKREPLFLLAHLNWLFINSSGFVFQHQTNSIVVSLNSRALLRPLKIVSYVPAELQLPVFWQFSNKAAFAHSSLRNRHDECMLLFLVTLKRRSWMCCKKCFS